MRVNCPSSIPERVGSHWAADAQIDVVAINWRLKQILLGEAKWTGKAMKRSIVRELIDKTEGVVPAKASAEERSDWNVHYAFFSRSGFTDAARAEANHAL